MIRKKNPEFEKCKFLIKKLCKEIEKINWAKEVKLAKKLLKLLPDFSFWESVHISEANKTTSLTWYLTDEGKGFLNSEKLKKKLELPPKMSYDLQKNKVAGDKIFSSKPPKTVLEFLKNK